MDLRLALSVSMLPAHRGGSKTEILSGVKSLIFTQMKTIHRRLTVREYPLPMADNSQTEIIAHLERITSSSIFATSPRLIQFLRFCVTTSLNGEAEQLKESTIGVSVFGRDPDYNPRTDPIVRVHARRLRDKLETFYETEGQDEPIKVEIRKGGYVPRFERRNESFLAARSKLDRPLTKDNYTVLKTPGLTPAFAATHYKPSPISSLAVILSTLGFVALFVILTIAESHSGKIAHL